MVLPPGYFFSFFPFFLRLIFQCTADASYQMHTDLFYEMQRALGMMATPQRAGVWISGHLTWAMGGDFTWVCFSKIIKERKTATSSTGPTAPLEEALQGGSDAWPGASLRLDSRFYIEFFSGGLGGKHSLLR